MTTTKRKQGARQFGRGVGMVMWCGLSMGLCLGLAAGCASSLEGLEGEGEGDTVVEAELSAASKARAAFVKREITAWNADLPAASRTEKYGLMAASPGDFLRGTDHLFWADNAHSPDLARYGAGIFLSGDLHVGNLGSYANDQGTVVFGMNDYDQSVIADYQLDLWRLATSLVLEGRAQGITKAKLHTALDAFVEAYLDELDNDRAGQGHAALVFDQAATKGPVHDLLVEVGDRSQADLLDKWTILSQGARVFDLSQAELAAVSPAVARELINALVGYQASLHKPLPGKLFQVKAVAERLHAGLGSLGLPRYYVLVEGPSSSPDDDAILDVKTAVKATAYTYLSSDLSSDLFGPSFPSEGERIATAQRALDLHVDDALGWFQLGERSFIVRTLSFAKGALGASAFKNASNLKSLAQQLGTVIAAFHERSDQDFRPDLIPYDFAATVHDLTDGNHDDVRAKIWAKASSYADQVTADWTAFKKSPPL